MVKQFTIILNQDAAQTSFVPGSTIGGSLLVEVEEPKSYKQIAVYLKGQGRVSWSTGSGDNRRSYYASEVYVSLECVVWRSSESSDGSFPTGHHTFPFEFILPASCPSSYKANIGSITYLIEGVISTGQLKFDHKVYEPFVVLESVSINNDVTQAPVHIEERKTVGFWCCKSGEITFSVQVLRTGFYIGEEIPVRVYVENGSGRRVVARCELVETIEFIAQGSRRWLRDPLVQHRADPIQPHTTIGEIALNFVIPQIRPAMNRSNIIKSFHAVNVTIEIPWALNATISIPVSIGNTNVLNQTMSHVTTAFTF